MLLPIHEIESQIVEQLRRGNRLVLTAPTGSGKTTQVPQIIARAGVLPPQQQIIVLQPRRLATRMVARRVAHEMGSPLGALVGYQTRHDSVISPQTRIRFMTEGLLLRLMQSDPELPGVGAVVLDEFHERSLAADMSLALVKRLQESRRRDLKLIVMSATLDAEIVSQYLNCPTLRAGGQLFPVDVQYAAKLSTAPIWEQAAAALRDVLARGEEGDVLIFMPGVYEINRTIEACMPVASASRETLAILPLHGTLRPQDQDAALEPAQPGTRKIVVATNVAETSLTIEGIRIVIDSGLAKIHRFEPQREMNVLRTEPISRASADQRAGRAGRTAPGLCIRLWTQRDHAQRAAHDVPEIRRLELSESLLQLKSMDLPELRDIASFPWLEPPDPRMVERAMQLLHMLDAIDAAGELTATGRAMAKFPTHPRLSRMMLEAAQRGCLGRATLWAAIIGERDLFNTPDRRVLLRYLEANDPLSDLIARERAIASKARDPNVNAMARRDIEHAARGFAQVCKRLKLPIEASGTHQDLIKSLLVAYPDHVAMKLDATRPHCAMPNRRRVVLDRESVVQEPAAPGPILAVEVRETGSGDRVQTQLALATRIEPAWLEELFPEAMQTQIETVWNPQSQSVEKIEQHTYNGLPLSRIVRQQVDPARAAEVLAEQILTGNLKLEHWNEKVEQWIARVRFVARLFPDRGLIQYDDDDLRVILHEIVSSDGGATRYSQIKDRPCMNAVRDALSWDDQQFVEKMAPESIALPGHPRNWRMKLEYAADPSAPPKGRAKIQDLYGLEETPRIAGGRQPILLEILGPNFRPVQITSDLKNFWQTLYPELKKELKRRYPKHEWR